MNKKQLLTSAVTAALVAPFAALAAIDDQGMAYVSAGEGLSGSLRHDILIDTNVEGEDVSSKTNSLRLWVSGDLDLGGGLKSTYYYEFRGGGRGDPGLNTEAYDIGLKGPFGSFSVGDLGMVAPRMVPSASLAFERGTNRESFAADPGSNGLRYESPVINGFQFGVSGVLNGTAAGDDPVTPTNKDSLDEFSLAVKYTLPVGLELGAGYESKENDVDLSLTTYSLGVNIDAAVAILTISTAPVATVGADAPNALSTDSLNGFRFGARYAQDNWLLAYEYRTYDSFRPNDLTDYFEGGASDVAFTTGTAPNSTNVVAHLNDQIKSGDKGLEYDVHAVGVMATVDRVVLTAGYSTEENAYTGNAATRYVLERDTIALDAAYKLGSRSTMVVGWLREDYDADVSLHGVAARGTKDVSTTYLFYRIDF